MAQRAYRQRKESTLDELRRRVSDLTTTVARMNRAFEDCRHRLVQGGLPESQMYDLAEVSICFTNLMKSVRNPDDVDEEAAPSPRATKRKPSVHSGETPVVPTGKNVPAWIDQTVLSHTNKRHQRSDLGMGYNLITPESVPFEDLATNFNVPALARAVAHNIQPEHDPTSDQASILPFAVTNLPHIPSEMSTPKTYSFQETSLARRLHRACAEAAYHLLLDPGRLPHTYDRAFKLSLLGRDRQKLAASMKLVIDRGPEEDLDFWQAPLIHIGGAGTHYPSRNRNGVLQPKKQTYHLGLIGPQTLTLLETAVRDKTTADMTVEVAGFEGEWLDPYDVEGYLEEKGIHINALSSFAEAVVTEVPVGSASVSTSSSLSGPETPPGQYGQQQTNYFGAEQFRELESLSVDVSRWEDVANLEVSGVPSVGFSDANTGSWMNFIDPNTTGKHAGEDHVGMFGHHDAMDDVFNHFSHEPTPDPRPVSKKTVIIDVAKFIKGEHHLSAPSLLTCCPLC